VGEGEVMVTFVAVAGRWREKAELGGRQRKHNTEEARFLRPRK